MNKKLYFFIPYYPKHTTGGNKYHAIIYEILSRKHKSIYVFGCEKNMEKIDKSKILKIIYGIRYSLKIPKFSTIVLSNTAFLHFLIPVFILNIFKKHNYFMIVHHLLKDESTKILVKYFEKLFIKSIENKITVSNSTLKKMKEYGMINSDIPIINPGLDYIPDLKYARENINDRMNLLFVGNIERRKALLVLIKALEFVDAGNFELTVIGKINDREYFNQIKSCIKILNIYDFIKFRENIDKDELLDFYKSSDILIFPSEWEGFGMVITEAMSFGLPVIASRIPTTEEIITDLNDGLLFSVNDSLELGSLINRLKNDCELYKRLSVNGIKKAMSQNNWESVADNVTKYINL